MQYPFTFLCCKVLAGHGWYVFKLRNLPELTAKNAFVKIESFFAITIKGQISIYPNPNNGQFTIGSSVASGQLSVEVYNVLGEKVYSKFNIQHPTFNIDISSQAAGIYLYRVIKEDGSLLGEGKVIVQK